MSKLYAPLGYAVDFKARNYYDSEIEGEMLAAVLSLAQWPPAEGIRFKNMNDEQLKQILLDNGFEEKSDD